MKSTTATINKASENIEYTNLLNLPNNPSTELG